MTKYYFNFLYFNFLYVLNNEFNALSSGWFPEAYAHAHEKRYDGARLGIEFGMGQ